MPLLHPTAQAKVTIICVVVLVVFILPSQMRSCVMLWALSDIYIGNQNGLRSNTTVTIIGETNSVIYKFTSIGMIRDTYCPIYIHKSSMIIN